MSKTYPACKGTNCGCTDGLSHSPECRAEHEAAATGFNRTCETCAYWRTRWAAKSQKGQRGGCAKTRRSTRFTVLDNVAREARFGWLETPKEHACILWDEKKPKKAKAKLVDNC